MKRVVIVGGGIAGLTTAHTLERASETCEVHLVEAAPQLGGNLVTMRHNGFIIDGGPDSWVASKPHAARLAREVGLGDEIIGTRPDSRKVFILWQKKLHTMPEGLVLGVPTELRPFLDTELLGFDAKMRAGLDLLVPPKKWDEEADESIAAFVERRLGPDVAERIVGPLLGGIFAGDPKELSVRACVPQLVDAEREHGSLIRAMRALRAKRREEAGDNSAFLSLKRGVGDLVLNVAHKLRDAHVTTSCAARGLERLTEGDERGRWAVDTQGGVLYADDVALCVPAHVSSKLLRGIDDDVASLLDGVAYASTATVFLAYRKFDVRHPLDGAGFLVPRAEGRPILACTFVSSKWDHRAPAGQVLLRVFFGGAGNEAILAKDDADLVEVAREQILDILEIDRPPAFSKVFRFQSSSPQPAVGHVTRLTRALAKLEGHGGLHMGGNGYLGTGISDAIRQGTEIAQRIARLDRATVPG